MKTCLKCGTKFSIHTEINGVMKNLGTRKYCLTCSPFLTHNTTKLHQAHSNGLRKCPHCERVLAPDKFYRRRRNNNFSVYCKDCSSQQVVARQQVFKEKCVAYKGGKCERCGYKKSLKALQFHHKDPNKKENIVSYFKLHKFEAAIPELNKCAMLCANCHVEVHEEIYEANMESRCGWNRTSINPITVLGLENQADTHPNPLNKD